MTVLNAPSPEFEADLVVDRCEMVADDVIVVDLVHPDGDPLPAWTPGAHIDLVLTPEITRQYSLCGTPGATTHYTVGILRELNGRGGSQLAHETIEKGVSLRIRGPRNHFPLEASAKYVFIAGGIGITPILPMITAAEDAGAEWTLLYGGRSEASMAFTDELGAFSDRVTLLPGTDIAPMAQALDALLGTPRADTLVYACGPQGLLTAIEQRCSSWPSGSLHVERFTAKALDDGDNVPFVVKLARSGFTITVPADRSIFEAAEDKGVSVLGSCREGVCGTCETVVLDIDGEVDHRDSILNEDEKDLSETMMICVSRCRSGSITLDL